MCSFSAFCIHPVCSLIFSIYFTLVQLRRLSIAMKERASNSASDRAESQELTGGSTSLETQTQRKSLDIEKVEMVKENSISREKRACVSILHFLLPNHISFIHFPSRPLSALGFRRLEVPRIQTDFSLHPTICLTEESSLKKNKGKQKKKEIKTKSKHPKGPMRSKQYRMEEDWGNPF